MGPDPLGKIGKDRENMMQTRVTGRVLKILRTMNEMKDSFPFLLFNSGIHEMTDREEARTTFREKNVEELLVMDLKKGCSSIIL